MQTENIVQPGVRGLSFIWFCLIQNAILLQFSAKVVIQSGFEVLEDVFRRDAHKKWDEILLTSTEKKTQHFSIQTTGIDFLLVENWEIQFEPIHEHIEITAPPCSPEAALHVLISESSRSKWQRTGWCKPVCVCSVCMCLFPSSFHIDVDREQRKWKIIQSSWMLKSLATSFRSVCSSPSLIIYK